MRGGSWTAAARMPRRGAHCASRRQPGFPQRYHGRRRRPTLRRSRGKRCIALCRRTLTTCSRFWENSSAFFSGCGRYVCVYVCVYACMHACVHACVPCVYVHIYKNELSVPVYVRVMHVQDTELVVELLRKVMANMKKIFMHWYIYIRMMVCVCACTFVS